jgi:pyruvate kinase
MVTKKLIVLLVAMAFALGVVGVSLSAAQEIKGTVAKIEGDKVTIQDAAGKQTTVSVNDPTMLKDLKVGDRVSIKDGKLTKEKM